MLTTLTTIKQRLAIPGADPQYDTLLTNTIKAVSARFDKETRRTLARTENFTQEFDGATTEVVAACYPIESVSKFETKTSESSGWQEITPTPDYLIRQSCIISLRLPLNFQLSTFNLQLFRAIYTGGYVLPGDIPAPGQTPLPADLESAAAEQAAFWFQHRDDLGIDTMWPHEGTYKKYNQADLLPEVRAVLNKYTRFTL